MSRYQGNDTRQMSVQSSLQHPSAPGNPHQTYLSIGDMPSMGMAQQTMLWQQNQYLSVDSGINSLASTRTPSISSKIESDDSSVNSQPLYNHDGYSMPSAYGHQVNGINETSIMGDNTPVIIKPAIHNHNSMNKDISLNNVVHDQANPHQMLWNAVTNLITYQDDSDLAQLAIPELARLLYGDDHVVVGQAATMVQQLSKKEATRLAIINSPQMIASLVHGINATADAETVRCIAGTFHNLSHHVQGLQTIYRARVVPTLVKLLSSNIDSIVFYAITTLHNLLLKQEGATESVRRENGVERMVSLLHSNNDKFLAITTDCLKLLTFEHADSKRVVLLHSGTARLVRIMQTYSYEKLLWTTSRLLKVLSVCPENKLAIIRAGGISALAMHLHTSNLTQNCLWTLRNLSDAPIEGNVDHLLQILLSMLNNNMTLDTRVAGVLPNLTVDTCAAGILSNLTCNNESNKLTVFHSGGVTTLTRILFQYEGMEEIIEAAVRALRHLTSHHPGAELAQDGIRMCNGIPLLIKLMQPPSRWPLIKAILGLIRNLAFSPRNQDLLREHGAIHKVAQIVLRAHQDTQRSPFQPVFVDGENMVKVLEGAVGTLHIMSRNAQNRAVIRNLCLVPVLDRLLHYPNENIQRVATGVLTELASEAEGVAMIKNHGADARLMEPISSHNGMFAKSDTKLLYQIKEDRHVEPQHFHQRIVNYGKSLPSPANIPSSSMCPQKPLASWNNWRSSSNEQVDMKSELLLPNDMQLLSLDLENNYSDEHLETWGI